MSVESLGGSDPHPSVLVLLGAGRGGTTLLHKLLALHRDVGYLSNYQQRFPRVPALASLQRVLRDRHTLKLATWFQPDGGAYFQGARARLHALVPAPIECESIYATCGVPLMSAPGTLPDEAACARLRQAFAAVQRWAGARIVITKRTANNRRVAWLERAFPGARYVHLVRDGRAVARSLMQVNWWRGHTLFWAGRTPADLVAEGQDELELAARNWVEEMAQLQSGLAAVSPERVLTIHYEQVLASPHQALQAMLAFGGVDSNADPGYATSIDRVGLRPVTSNWDRGLDPEARARLLAVQSGELERWGYVDSNAIRPAV